jgi:hypothetical protein
VVRLLAAAVAVVLAGCATTEQEGAATRPMTASEGRALIVRLLPESVGDRNGWATDIYAAFASLDLPANADNFCAAIAVIGQESGFTADPPVPGLAKIARAEIDKRRESAGIPKFALDAALALPSTDGRSYGERLDAVKTERQLSLLYEDFIDRVPFGKALLADRNPVRTGGPMQVSIAFAETFSAEKPYPYPIGESIRHEVFTRRGGVYFGVAHLLDYPAPYSRQIHRFADFNAGQYASRNAAFQQAVTQASGVPLALDGDLLRYERGEPAREPGSTELAVRVLARRMDVGNDEIRRDLASGKGAGLERTKVYLRVFGLVDAPGNPAPRAVLPRIPLSSPKITRPLTTDWFANRVQARYEACLARATPKR